MRLDKYLSSVTNFSRAEAKKLLRQGRVTVASAVTKDPSMAIIETAIIAIDGEPLRRAGHRYFMLHKPQGYISATKDRTHLTALELLDEDNTDQLHIAGRLDIDTTGLLLITDDGGWSHRVTSPRRECKKTYYLETAECISIEQAQKIEQGIKLDGEKRPTLAAKLQLIDDYSARLTISEGKYHQVKRMFAAVGNHVEKLHREKIGAILLDKNLAEGEYRPLTAAEVASL